MAFQIGERKINGTIGGISFYESDFGWLVRKKGGPSRKQFKTSAAFVRSRESSAEFVNCSKMASQVRREILNRTSIEDPSLYHRLLKLMRLLANEDRISRRGERLPLNGMKTSAGRRLIQEFVISDVFTLSQILMDAWILEPCVSRNAGEKIKKQGRTVFRRNTFAVRLPMRGQTEVQETRLLKKACDPEYFINLVSEDGHASNKKIIVSK